MSKTIDILVTLDAAAIMSHYPNSSKNENSPTSIGSNFVYMLASTNAQSGNGTGDLRINANVADSVLFSCVTASNNRVNSALIYAVTTLSGENVFSIFSSQSFLVRMPEPSGSIVLPAVITEQKLWVYSANVIRQGTEQYGISFAVYSRDQNGNLELFGYFKTDSMIYVYS